MKRTLLIVAMVFTFLFATTTALAAGQWHYCDLCGREHSGVRCPEACQNDCSLNATGSVHKWYDCPERVVTACWYCKDESGNHNENTCPSGEIVWNDIKGTFRDAKYFAEDGVRLPQYCEYCEHYGYHSSNECIKNPNRLIIEVTTPKPEPTAIPTLEPTVIPTPEPTTIPTSKPIVIVEPTKCIHRNLYVEKSVVYNERKTPKYCDIIAYNNQAVCSECNYRGDFYQTFETIEHTMYNGKCTKCGYSEEPSTTECSHQTITEYCASNIWYEDGEDICYRKYKVKNRCYHCGATISDGVHTDERSHIMEDGICVNCGKHEANTGFENIQPDSPATEPEPITTPLVANVQQTQTVVVNNETTWWQIAIIIIAFILIMVIVCKIYKSHEQGKLTNNNEASDAEVTEQDDYETNFVDDEEKETEE